MSSTDKAAPVPRSVGRVLDLLEIVLACDGCNLTTAANEAGLTPTSALRHLRALEARGYLTRDAGGRFGVGPTMVRLAAGFTARTTLDTLIDAAQPILDGLAAATGESAYLAIAGDDEATYVARAESAKAIRHAGWVGQRVPLTSSALGAALGRPGATEVRAGAVEPDVTAVSRALAPVGTLRPALSVIGPSHRLDQSALTSISAVLEAAVARLDASVRPALTPNQELPA